MRGKGELHPHILGHRKTVARANAAARKRLFRQHRRQHACHGKQRHHGRQHRRRQPARGQRRQNHRQRHFAARQRSRADAQAPDRVHARQPRGQAGAKSLGQQHRGHEDQHEQQHARLDQQGRIHERAHQREAGRHKRRMHELQALLDVVPDFRHGKGQPHHIRPHERREIQKPEHPAGQQRHRHAVDGRAVGVAPRRRETPARLRNRHGHRPDRHPHRQRLQQHLRRQHRRGLPAGHGDPRDGGQQ